MRLCRFWCSTSRGSFCGLGAKGLFEREHFLRVYGGHVWVTDRGTLQAYEFDLDGKLLMTLGKKGVPGDNSSEDAFNGVADVAVGKNGRCVYCRRRRAEYTGGEVFEGWEIFEVVGRQGDGGRGSSILRTALRWMGTGGSMWRTGRMSGFRFLMRHGKFLDQWKNFGTPWGLLSKGI